MKKNIDMKSVYDEIYEKIEKYNFADELKNRYVDAFSEIIKGKILDAGCGEGLHLKRLLNNGCDVFGIEISEVCCEKYLKGVPHENIDILSYCKISPKYDGLICMDVLEHIEPGKIVETIKNLSSLSPLAFFGIANHSDVLNGVELHLIQEDSNYWFKLLSKFYKKCFTISELSYQSDRKIFYVFLCVNEDDIQENHYRFNNNYGPWKKLQKFREVDQSIIDDFYKKLCDCYYEKKEIKIELESAKDSAAIYKENYEKEKYANNSLFCEKENLENQVNELRIHIDQHNSEKNLQTMLLRNKLEELNLKNNLIQNLKNELEKTNFNKFVLEKNLNDNMIELKKSMLELKTIKEKYALLQHNYDCLENSKAVRFTQMLIRAFNRVSKS